MYVRDVKTQRSQRDHSILGSGSIQMTKKSALILEIKAQLDFGPKLEATLVGSRIGL
jgi:hypothetical protein